MERLPISCDCALRTSRGLIAQSSPLGDIPIDVRSAKIESVGRGPREEESVMFRKVLIGAASGLSLVALSASPSLALDTLMLPNGTSGTMPYSSQGTPLTSTGDKDKDKSSFHFSVSGSSGGQNRNMFAPNSFGPNSDRSNPMGPDRTYGPPTSETNDPFFHN